MASLRRTRGGFVLLELVVVVCLIGLIAAIAFPALLPALAFSRLEGAGRHLAAYGQSVMAHCAMMREPITVKFDLDDQQYWCVRWIMPEDKLSEQTLDLEEDEEDSPFGFADLPEDPADFDEQALEEKALSMEESFGRFARMALLARAQNALREESIMDEFDPLFEKEFSLDDDEPEEEEIVLPLLNRTAMPEEVMIESIVVSGAEHTRGVVEVALSPLGLLDPVTIYVKDAEDDEYFTVKWDPVTGLTYLLEGKEPLAE